jgi:vacuolar-type H+-ATPase subunit I/STV1
MGELLMPVKAKKTTKKTEKHVNGKHGEVISVEDFNEMQEYFSTAKDLIVIHDDEINDVKESLKELHNKIDRALSRLGIS